MFEYQLSVRGYELDSYGHVNNAVYLNYYEQARWDLVQRTGILKEMQDREVLLVVTDINIRYSHEALLFDPIRITTRVEFDGSFVIFHHRMTHAENGRKLSHCKVRTVVIDKQRIPQSIPEEIKTLLQNGGE